MSFFYNQNDADVATDLKFIGRSSRPRVRSEKVTREERCLRIEAIQLRGTSMQQFIQDTSLQWRKNFKIEQTNADVAKYLKFVVLVD